MKASQKPTQLWTLCPKNTPKVMQESMLCSQKATPTNGNTPKEVPKATPKTKKNKGQLWITPPNKWQQTTKKNANIPADSKSQKKRKCPNNKGQRQRPSRQCQLWKRRQLIETQHTICINSHATILRASNNVHKQCQQTYIIDIDPGLPVWSDVDNINLTHLATSYFHWILTTLNFTASVAS